MMKPPSISSTTASRLRSLVFASGVSVSAVLAQPASEDSPGTPEEKPADTVVVIDAFTVSSERGYGYRSSNSISATRTNTPIRDVPLNIQVFTPDLIDDLEIGSQLDLYAYSAAIVDGGRDLYSSNSIQPSSQVVFRGFGYGFGLRDGIREQDPVDAQNLARVEVVKGPAAALYGITLPGGVVQSITKPVEFDHRFARLHFTVGDEDDYRATIDANYFGRIAGTELGVRINGVQERSQDERVHSRGRAELAAAALAWRATPSTLAEFFVERGYRAKPNGLGWFTRPEFPDSYGYVSLNRAEIPLQVVHPEIPWTWNWSNGKNLYAIETHRYLGAITQRFGEALQVRAYWQYLDRRNSDANGWGAYGDPGPVSWLRQLGWNTGWVTDPATQEEHIQSAYTQQDWSNKMHAYGATAVYKFAVHDVKNTFAFGTAIWREEALGPGRSEDTPTYQTYPVRADIPLPVPSAPPSGVKDRLGMDQDNSNDITFVNWQASWLHDRLKTNAGFSRARYQLIEHPTDYAAETRVFAQSQNSPLAGAVFALTRDLSFFALYATSLFPDPSSDSRLRHFSPIVGKNLESGFKFETAREQLSGTVSAYRIVFSGGSQFDPSAINATPGLIGDLVQGGEQVSTGVEADFVWQPVRSWQLVVSYAHNNQQITKSAQAYTIGQSALEHVNDRRAVVSKYTFAEGPAKGLYLGLGLSSGSKALKDYIEWPAGTGRYVARYEPGRTIVDFFGGWPFKLSGRTALVQLNIKNLTHAPDYVGWHATGSSDVLATERYRAPTRAVYRLMLGIDF